MNKRFRTPHTFDMSNYFFGQTFEVGGIDFDREEKESTELPRAEIKQTDSFKLDWSFLKKKKKLRTSRR